MTNAATTAQLSEDGGPKICLGIMMFLQYAVWGVWLPVLAIYLMATVDDGGLGFSGAVGLDPSVSGSGGRLGSGPTCSTYLIEAAPQAPLY